MASGLTQFGANLLLEKLLRGTAGTFPATGFVGLFSATPSDTYTSGSPNGTELTTGVVGAYARVSIGMGTSTGFAVLSAGSTSNSAAITFPTATSGTGVSVTQWGLFDASTTGNLFFWADLTTPQTVANGNPYSFAIGALVISII